MYYHPRSRAPRRNSSKSVSALNIGLAYGLVGATVHGVERAQRGVSGHEQTVHGSQTQSGGIGDKEFKERPHSSDKILSKQENTIRLEGLPPAPRRAHPQRPASSNSKGSFHGTQGQRNLADGSLSQDLSDLDLARGIPGSLSEDTIHDKYQRWDSEGNQPVQISAQPSMQALLPGDRVVFSESPSSPGIPIVYRTAEEKHSNPDKLNLDRRNLTVCPVLEGEENLRLLNYQHNLIQRIQHISNLRKLIFLDLYDNRIQEISGLSALKSLRVLMLGKNRIKHINNLEDLVKLDVLDLHGNKITKIENLSHLAELRVLNLASNELVSVQNITGLHSLAELNLRRNKICTVMEVNTLPCLQRIFLSYNEIKRFEDISSLSGSITLTEVALDGNPFAVHSQYKQTVLQNVKNIRQLDMRRISDEEKRIAVIMFKKEEERRRESDRAASLREKRKLAILNAQRQWELQFRDTEVPSLTGNKDSLDVHEKSSNRPPSQSSSLSEDSSSRLSCDNSDYSVCHLAELDGEELNLYGPGALDAIERNWGDRTSGGVSTVKFHYIAFDDIVPHLPKVRLKFPACHKLYFIHNDIRQLVQLNALAIMNRLEVLHISEEGNPVTLFTLWKPYTIFRLSHVSLRQVNDTHVGTEEMVHAEKLFGSLGHMTMSKLPQSRLMVLLKSKRRLEGGQDISDKGAAKATEGKESRTASGEPVSRAALSYWPTSEAKQTKEKEQRSFCKSYFQELLQMAALSDRKRSALEKLWPKVFNDMVLRAVQDMADLDFYMKDSLDKIKAS